MTNEIDKKDPVGGQLDTQKGKIRFGQGSALHQRVVSSANKAQAEETASATMPNRISLMADDSGSMAGPKVELARIALTSFLEACDPSNTSASVHTLNGTVNVPQTRMFPIAAVECATLRATGGTPLAQLMERVLTNESLTRGVIVSDGEPDSAIACFDQAQAYKESGTPIDCVHIGESASGEETLAKIASVTGGLYIKFDKVENFAENFKFLTPRYRALLGDAKSAAKLLGAKEVR